jgi:2-amino-4-hydroxy-6-hydroxymethyldihydropteridine diphosphokinase
MITGVGVDIVDVNRFANAPEKLITMFLGWNEIKEFEKRNRCRKYLAARFAAKEAFIKPAAFSFQCSQPSK